MGINDLKYCLVVLKPWLKIQFFNTSSAYGPMYLHASPHFVFDFHVYALAHEESITNSWRQFHTIPLIDSVWRQWANKGGNAQQQRQ